MLQVLTIHLLGLQLLLALQSVPNVTPEIKAQAEALAQIALNFKESDLATSTPVTIVNAIPLQTSQNAPQPTNIGGGDTTTISTTTVAVEPELSVTKNGNYYRFTYKNHKGEVYPVNGLITFTMFVDGNPKATQRFDFKPNQFFEYPDKGFLGEGNLYELEVSYEGLTKRIEITY